MRLHEFIKDADDQEVTELIGAVARGIGGAVKAAPKLAVGAAKLGYKGAAGLASVMDPKVGAAMKGQGAVANALAKTEFISIFCMRISLELFTKLSPVF